MLIVSYDIQNDRTRARFAKMLTKNGAIRLQYSVYEVNNTDRILNNLRILTEEQFAKKFEGGDSVVIFDAATIKLKKYGNAIHRDEDVVYF
ncbi:MAG: CRISPR-associated endonuclease Cas2 [Bacteroidales bacterium]|nr:CRISPR-associated endonuclease Cas2 [Bacteroidales bacterium]